MTQALHREAGGWTVTLVFIIIVLLVLLFMAAGLAAFAFHLAGQHRPDKTALAAEPAGTVRRFSASHPKGIKSPSEVPVVDLDRKAEPFDATAIVEADKAARAFLGSIVINDIDTLKSLSTKELRDANPYRYLRDGLLYTTGLQKEAKLIGLRATGEKIELQYRTQSMQGQPWDLTLTLLKDGSGYKVDDCEGRGR